MGRILRDINNGLMNRMINHLTDTNLRAFSSTLDKKMRAMIEAQHDLLDQLNESIEEDERAQIKSSFRTRQEAMQKTMDEWNSFTGNINSRLSIMDRKASDVLYWNRRRNLKDLEREARYRFDDIADEAESMSKKISKNFNEIAESLRDWSTALNVDQLASGLEDSQKSMRDLRIDLQKHMKLSNEEWSKLRDDANKFSADNDYAIENTKYIEGYSSMIKAGYDKEVADKMAGSLTKFAEMTEVNADSMSKFLEMSSDSRLGSDYLKNSLSAIMKIQQEMNGVSGDQMTSALNENINNYGALAGNNSELFKKYTNQSMALTAASSKAFIPDLDTRLNEIMNMSYSDIGQNTGLAAIGGVQIKDAMIKGDFKSAAELYMTGLSDILKQTSNDPNTRQDYLQALDLDVDKELESKLQNPQYLKDFSTSFDQATQLIQEQTNAQNKFIDEWKPEVSVFEKYMNEFKASWLGGQLDDACNALGLSATEMLAAIYFTKNIFGGVAGKLGGFTWKIGGKAFDWFKGSGAGKAVGAGLGKAGGIAKEGVSKGASALGNIAKSGASKVGGVLPKAASLLTNPAVLSKLNVAGAIASLGYGAYEGADKAKDWLGDDSAGSKVAAGIGGALGGTGPGLLDEGSATDKAINIAEGAMKGAMIGSIIPGVGTAVGAVVGGTLSAVGGENIAKFASGLGTTISDGWNSFTEWGGNAIDSIGTKFNDTWDSVGQWGSSTWDSLSTSAGKVSDSIRQGMHNAWESISTFISDKVKSLGEVMNSTWDSTINFFSGIFQGFFDGIKSKFAWIIDPIRKVYDKITGNGKKPGTPGTPGIPREKSIFDKAKDAIKDTTVGKLATEAVDAVGSLFGGDKSTNPATPTESGTPNSIKPDGSHAHGLNYVPFDGYLAELHKGEAVLNSFQADYWRNHMPQASANSETWTPNDNSDSLDSASLAKVNNNYNNTNNESSSSSNSSTEISSNDDVVQAIQWLCRELKTAIMQDNASSSSTTNMMMQYLMRNTGKGITPSDQVFSFVK